MATATIKRTQLRLVLETGLDGNGNPVFRNKNFNNVKPETSADDLHMIAHSLASLQVHELFEIERTDLSSIEE